MKSSDERITMTHAMKPKNTEYLTVRLGEDLKAKLQELAERNERDASKEARLAIRLHVEDELRIHPIRPVAGDDGPAA